MVRGTAVYIESIVSKDGMFEDVEASSFYCINDLRSVKL